jgi:iron complex outermembrane recepter protein
MNLVPRKLIGLALLLSGFVTLAARAQEKQTDLTTLNIEDLMNIDVTSASKKEQKLSQVAAAIFVITKEDIHRSGITNLPDLLRMAPGMDVAQVTASAWAVSARGFNGQYAPTLLVLIDGRSVYTPVFSGVYWDAQAVPLDSIERIEIIRGPGAAVWGANAVNGVVNIITKRAQDMPGGYVSGQGGTIGYGAGLASYGGNLRNHGAYRIYLDGFTTGQLLTFDYQAAHDDWHRIHGGFRADLNLPRHQSLTLEGEALRGNAGKSFTLTPPLNTILVTRDIFSGWDLLTRWTYAPSNRSQTSFQAYFERSNRENPSNSVALNTVDLDFQQQLAWGSRQDIVWGLGFRHYADEIPATPRVSFDPSRWGGETKSAFIQDELTLWPERLALSAGVKLEDGYYNGFNAQPTARLRWTPTGQSIFWASVSGAQAIPSQSETSIEYSFGSFLGPENLIGYQTLYGNPNQKNQHIKAFEAGYRQQWSSLLSFDIAAFFSEYRSLLSQEPGTQTLVLDPPPPHWLVPTYLSNRGHGETHGIEVFANVKLTRWWTLTPGYSFLAMHLHPDTNSADHITPVEVEGLSPTHQAQLRSQMNLPERWQWTTSAYFVDRLPYSHIPSYTRLDSNFSWQLSDRVSFSVAGQNLLRNTHPEFAGYDVSENPSLIRRSGYARLTWRF